MKIVEMEIRAFGRLEDRHFVLGDGMNVIHGLNESGKTTLLAFIRAMLFGLERGRGRASREDAYTRFRPWGNPGKYGGWLDLELGGRRYRMNRDFAADPRDLKVVDLATGAEVTDFVERILRPVGINESNFRNAMLLEADRGPVAAELAAALGDKLVHMATGGDRELAASRAVEKLRTQRRQLERSLPTARLAELEQRFLQVREWDRELAEIQKEHKEDMEKEAAETKTAETKTAEARTGKTRPRSRGYVLAAVIGLVLAVIFWNQMKAVAILLPVVIVALYALWGKKRERSFLQVEQAIWEERAGQEERASQENRLIARGRRLARMEQLENSLDAAGSLWAEWNQVRQQLESQKEEIQVLATAESLLRQVSEEVRQDFGAAFAKGMERGLAEIVAGREGEMAGRRLYLDEGFQIRLEENGQIQPLDRFSRGTVGQMQLIMNLSAGKLLFQEEMPLLLDDALTHYDDERTQTTLRYLAREHTGQILLCSHSQREAECLEEIGVSYRYVDLDEEWE